MLFLSYLLQSQIFVRYFVIEVCSLEASRAALGNFFNVFVKTPVLDALHGYTDGDIQLTRSERNVISSLEHDVETLRAPSIKAKSTAISVLTKTKRTLQQTGLLPPPPPCSPLNFAIILLLTGLPLAGLVYIFSFIGNGLNIIRRTREMEEVDHTGDIVGVIAFFIILYIYLFDNFQRKITRKGDTKGRTSTSTFPLLLTFGLLVAFLILKSPTQPTFIILLLTLSPPQCYVFLKRFFFNKTDFRTYLSWLTIPFYIYSAVLFGVWGWWVREDDGNEWNRERKVFYGLLFGYKAIPDGENLSVLPDHLHSCFTRDVNNEMQSCLFIPPDYIDSPQTLHEDYFAATGSHFTFFNSECSAECASLFDKYSALSFTIWASPLILGMLMLFLSFLSQFLTPVEDIIEPTDGIDEEDEDDVGSGEEGEEGERIPPPLKHQLTAPLELASRTPLDPRQFARIFLLLLFILWCTASLSGAGDGLLASFLVFFLGVSVAMGGVLVVVLGDRESREEVEMEVVRSGRESYNEPSYHGSNGKSAGKVVPTSTDDNSNIDGNKNNSSKDVGEVQKMLSHFKTKYGGYADGFRGFVIATTSPLIVVYIGLSMANQLVRRMRNKLTGEEKKRWFTSKAVSQQADFKSWDRARVYSISIYWCMAYIVLQVFASKFTVLFLSYMMSVVITWSLFAVTIVIVCVGMFLFLLPPIPGVPIYLTGGILLPSSATNSDTGSFPGGITGSVIYTVIVCLLIKLLACTLQQKGIGQPLSRKVWIRQFVGINSSTIRTMRVVLGGRGLSVAKVAILVGGPDWPTSVLCGIMRLPLGQILIGTLPVVLLILPTVLAGTFLWMSGLLNEEGLPKYHFASTMGTLFIVIAAIVQSSSMVVAAIHLEKAVALHSEQLHQIPIDIPVQQADALQLKKSLVYRHVTQWTQLPKPYKFVLEFGVLAGVLCCYITLLLPCFEPFELTSRIEDLPNGKFYNLLKPYGWVSMGLFAGSWFCLETFKSFSNKRVEEFIREGKVIVEDEGEEEEEWGEEEDGGNKSAGKGGEKFQLPE